MRSLSISRPSGLRALACHLDTPDDTLSALSSELKKMYSDGTIDNIMNKYR